ncbi:tyramine oxidase [Bacillus canaveralius]|uniref:Amine oxidase n=1 Tax=Bacillus canaveralius TaxID=1403243 RepID=A0A2N5GKL3_9BACI|nr:MULTISPECIES: primary-amine oxidase [Bacillus]PLR81454.1 tyramine oxidase [Bacillus sp. V33-4]PLR82065.1 tyramine oxidase [Bacillus canaveralius]PLR98029.1 tyramine oxidase [Bacillus canaveralius]RSK54391.1 primary-amine oxidase [Bacillus canaveralius]
MASITDKGKKITHPLEPLTVEEIALATATLKKEKDLNNSYRFVSVTLHEPPKAIVLNYKEDDPIERQAFLVLLDNAEAKTYEAIVSLNNEKVKSWRFIPNVQPAIMLDEFIECEKAVKENPEMQAAFIKRGITNFDLVMADPWSVGNFGFVEENGVRLARTLCWYKASDNDNGYARPISGLYAFVNLDTMQVVKVVDKEVIPFPPLDGNYRADQLGELRKTIKPLDIIQQEGPSFDINGHEISWEKWKIRFGFTPREGLVLHTVTYNDGGTHRSILYRASLSEMVVPYGDPDEPLSRNNAFDVGEYGVGMLANSLELGCDCLGEIKYFDVALADSRGNPVKIPNAICLHEEDFGILWKHTDWRTNHVEVRRSRRLVLSSISTVGNYEYGFFWYFYQDGNIEYEVKLTGIVHTQALKPGVTAKYGNLVAPQLYAAHHQHFFNLRLDMMVDGLDNSVCEVDTVRCDSPYGNAFTAVSTEFKTEAEAKRKMDLEKARYWKIINKSKKNIVDDPVGYKLFPGENCLPFADENSSLLKRAAFIKNHLWVTPFNENEKFAAGDYPNQHPGGDGLEKWTKENRTINNTDIVVWYTMGHHHITRPEDWPVMPTAYMGFSLKPVGFFDRNPALDVSPSKPKKDRHCSHH